MKKLIKYRAAFLGFLSLVAAPVVLTAQSKSLLLNYDRPAVQWTEALPVGNGFLGAMIYGGISRDTIQFNVSSFWNGEPRTYAHPHAFHYLDSLRYLLGVNRQMDAEALAEQHFMGIKYPDPEGYADSLRNWISRVVQENGSQWTLPSAADWRRVSMPDYQGWEAEGYDGLDGAVWLEKEIDIPDSLSGKTWILNLGKIRDQDRCFWNGKIIGTTTGSQLSRIYHVPASLVHRGKNVIVLQVLNYYDKGGLCGNKDGSAALYCYPENKVAQSIGLDGIWKLRVQDSLPPVYPQYEASYQPFGNLFLSFPERGGVRNYKRTLDLKRALASVDYIQADVHFHRTYFVSYPDRVMSVHLGADRPKSVSFRVELSSPQPFRQLIVGKNSLLLRLKMRGGILRGTAMLKVQMHGGAIHKIQNALEITGADSVDIWLAAETSYKNAHEVSANPDILATQKIESVVKQTYARVLRAHMVDFSGLMNRFSLNLGSAREDLTTDKRIRCFSIRKDPDLLALYTQFGRYLLISSSRQGGLPANLQGIWNDRMTPSWGSKYTTNINLEMNYWPADLLNLPEMESPLIHFIDSLSVAGRLTASWQYGAPGWVLHHNTDLWLATAPINAATHGVWPGGAAWLCDVIYDHFLYSQDTSFLKRQFPVLLSAAVFYRHFLVKDSLSGYLISTPSNSPEHGGMVAGPTMDNELIGQLFSHVAEAAHILGENIAFADSLMEMKKQLPPLRIGSSGALQEWRQDVNDRSDDHRHVSHLWGFYPGKMILWGRDTSLCKAVRQSLLYRGDGGTGWSLAWKACLWARLHDGNHELILLTKLLSDASEITTGEHGGVYPNLFDAHPPFQIDGNFGGAAAVGEMLLQSHEGYIELLPALPDALPSGSVTGLCARGAYQVDLTWQDGKLVFSRIHALKTGLCQVKYGHYYLRWTALKGHTYLLNKNLALSNDHTSFMRTAQ